MEDVRKGLVQYDFNYFVALFDHLLVFSNNNAALIKDVCFKLLSILFRYLNKKGIDDAIIEARNPKNYAQLDGFKQCTEMIAFIKELYYNILQFEYDKKDNYYHLLVADIKKFVEKNLSNLDLSLHLVAQSVNFSPDYIGKIFMNYSGMTVGKYITVTRMEKAASLLQKTRIPINEITEELGYTSSNYFAKVFKKIYNQTPSEYRRASLNVKR